MSGLLLIAVLDVEEEERARHDHAQDREGRQDAVQRQGDLPQLLQDDGLVFRRLGSCKAEEKTSAEPGAQSAREHLRLGALDIATCVPTLCRTCPPGEGTLLVGQPAQQGAGARTYFFL